MLSIEAAAATPVWPAVSTRPLNGLTREQAKLPVAVLGAGPVGLAAVAKLIERDIPFVVLEAGPAVGTSLLDYGHVKLFSPWQFNVDPSMARLLRNAGWTAPPPHELPLASEIVEKVLHPFAALPEVAGALQLRTKVTSVTRDGFDKVKSAGREKSPFVVRANQNGQPIEIRARAVIDSTGTWSTPNPLGAGGLSAIGEAEAAAQITYGIPDVLGAQRARHEGKKTLVVGAGHSAANVLLYLAELAKHAPATKLVWAVRSTVLARVFGGGVADALPARGQLGSALRQLRDSGALEFVAGLRVAAVRRDGVKLDVHGVNIEGERVVVGGIDEIVCATGQRPDLSLTSELRVKLDPWLESTEALGPLIDPNVHSCGTVRPHGHRELAHPEPGLYTVGVKSYGRAPTFLMATGFEQVRSVVAAIAGDLESADRVELELPETGVCSADLGGNDGSACCGAPEPKAGPSLKPVPSTATSDCGTSACSTSLKPPEPATAQASGCCGGPAKSDASACCALDETMKAQGSAGCGCSDAKPPVRTRVACCS